MADQKRNDGERGSDRVPVADPLGADAALRAGDNEDQQRTAAASADARATFGAAGPDRGDGSHMLATAGAVGGSAVAATRDVLRSAIGATEDVASDLVGGVTHVAAELVHGVRDIGDEVRDGATGLLGAVGTIGGTAVHTVAGVLADVVGGVRQVLGAAMGHNGHALLPEAPAGRAGVQPERSMPPAGPVAGAVPGAERAGAARM